MSKVAVVYWSGTGNTEKMANLIVSACKDAGAEVDMYFSDDFSSEKIADYDKIAFGCPAMGDEVLEEESFEPMFESCEKSLAGKSIALFGSYEWNDGQWMRDWEERCKGLGVNLVHEPVTAYGYPDDETQKACEELGKALA